MWNSCSIVEDVEEVGKIGYGSCQCGNYLSCLALTGSMQLGKARLKSDDGITCTVHFTQPALAKDLSIIDVTHK